jgi:hypothetical protein
VYVCVRIDISWIDTRRATGIGYTVYCIYRRKKKKKGSRNAEPHGEESGLLAEQDVKLGTRRYRAAKGLERCWEKECGELYKGQLVRRSFTLVSRREREPALGIL